MDQALDTRWAAADRKHRTPVLAPAVDRSTHCSRDNLRDSPAACHSSAGRPSQEGNRHLENITIHTLVIDYPIHNTVFHNYGTP